MSTAITDDRLTETDTSVIPEPEPTTPTPDELSAKAALYKPRVAGRKDGAEFCDFVYLEDDGGYAYRRVSPENNQSWRFMRTRDFEDNFLLFEVIDLKPYNDAMMTVLNRGVMAKRKLDIAINSMGPASRKRFERTIGKMVRKSL